MKKNITFNIRPMQVADIPGLCDMLKEHHRNEGKFYPEINEMFLAGALLNDAAQKHGKVFVAISNDGVIAGMISLEAFWFVWNPSLNHLRNTLLAVDRAYRSSPVADALIQKAREFAAESKMSLVLGIMSDDRAEVKDRLIKIKGGKYLGGNFLFEYNE